MDKKIPVPRREFMKRAAAGAAGMAAPALIEAQAPSGQAAAPRPPAPESAASDAVEVLTSGRSGSDFMVDVIKSLGVEYICSNPGSSFRGLHESIINYGGNEKPELLTCCHEESSVAMAHGYAKIEGKPMHGARARHRRPAARVHGDLQRVRAIACRST